MLFPPGVAAIKFACPSRLSGEAKKAPPPPPSIGRRSHNSFFYPLPPSPLSEGGKSSADDDGRQKEEDGAEAVSHGRFEEEGFLSSPPPFCEVALGRVTLNIGGLEMTG